MPQNGNNTQSATVTASATPPQQVDPRLQRLLTLLTLLKNARHKHKTAEIAFMIVNQTFNLVPYRHCIFWRRHEGIIHLEAASGLVQLDVNAPYSIWMRKNLSYLSDLHEPEMRPSVLKTAGDESYCKSFVTNLQNYDGPEKDQWSKWISAQGLFVPMKNQNGDIAYGLWIDRDDPFSDVDRALLEDLGDGYAHVLHRLEKAETRKESLFKTLFSPKKSLLRGAALAVIFAMLLPVRLSATAPAEVVSKSPTVVTIPSDGTIEKIAVEPNQSVKKGDLLIVMDSTGLRNRFELAEQELETVRAALDKTERESLRDPTKRAEINVLQAQIAAKEAERDFASELLERAMITAPESGIAIFSDPNALRGKPAGTGEQVMMIAKPEDTELVVRIPVDAMIEIDENVPVKFFLNVSPIGSKEAFVKTISYQATPDIEGIMSYKIRAQFKDALNRPRVGWTGTAKVYGQRTILLINILRRPFISLRRFMGV